MASTEEEILSTIMPNVLIDKITLFNDNSPDKIIKVKQREKGSFKQTIKFRKSKLPGKNIKVVVNLVVKEFLTKDIYGTWFDSIDIKKYININVIQTKDPKITEAFSLAVDMIELADPASAVPYTDVRQRALSKIVGINNFNDLQKYIEIYTDLKTISLNSPNQQSNSITEYPSYESNDGMTIYEIPYSVTFNINLQDGEDLEHLSYFVHGTIDLNKMAKDFSIQISDLKTFFQVTNVNSEIVIDKSEVVGYTNIYLTPDGTEWTGPIHIDQNGNYKTGIEEEDSTSSVLTVTKVANNKIQDFRNADEINKAVFDFSNLDNLYSKTNLTKIQSFDLNPSRNKSTYLSEIMISRSPNGQSNFSFGIDFYKIMKDNSPYGAYFSSFNERFKEECIKYSYIRSLKIIRRRVKERLSKSDIKTSHEFEVFDQNEPEDTIVISTEKKWKNFTNLNNFREINAELSADYPNIRFFSGADRKIISKTYGLYQYGIEIDIYDGTLEFIKEKVSVLNKIKVELTAYYNECVLSDNYNIPSDKFTRKFINEMNKKYGVDNIFAPWNLAASVYVDTLQIFSRINSIDNTRKTILNYLKPESASPTSITKVIELIDYLISSLSKTAKISVESLTTSNLDVNGSISASNKDSKVFKIKNYFDKYFDANIDKNFGVDILSDSTVTKINSDGLSKFTASNFNNRVLIETKKYFANENPKLDINGFSSNDNVRNTSHSYLTPSRFDLVGRSLALNEFLTISNNNRRQIEFLTENNTSENQKSLELLMSLLNFKYETFYNNKNGTSSRNRTSLNIRRREKINRNIINNDKNTIKKLKNSISELKGITIEEIQLRVTNNENNMIVVRSDTQRALSNAFSENNISQENNNNIEPDPIDEQTSNIGLKNFLTSLSLPLLTHQKTLSKFKRVNSTQGDNSLNLSSFDPITNIKSGINNIKPYQMKEKSAKTSTNSGLLSPNISRSQTNESNTITVTTDQITKKLPNQIKAIFNTRDVRADKISNFSINSFENNILYSPMNIIDYEMIVKIEYLDGFEKESRSSSVNIKKPVWKMLTFNDLQSFVKGKELICRLVSYENDKLNIMKNTDLEEILYDKYFLIQTERIVTQANILQDVRAITDFREIRPTQTSTTNALEILFPSFQSVEMEVQQTKSVQNAIAVVNASKFFGDSPSTSKKSNVVPSIRISDSVKKVR
jgi:hypothetical protein